MSCSRARSSPAYSPSLVSTARPATTAARSGSRSIVSRKARTRAGSGFHSTYSGGSKAGKRLISASPDLRQETAGVRRGERVGEFERGVVARVGVRFHRPGQRALQAFGEIGPELPQLLRLAAQPGDHHLLCVPPLEWQLAREHFEGDDR